MNKTWGRLARSWQRGPLRSGNGLRIIAHRGFRAAYPENTKSAFFASLGRSHMVELDVRLSLDNAVVRIKSGARRIDQNVREIVAKDIKLS